MKRHSYNNKQRRHNKNTLMKIMTYNFLLLEQPHSQERVGRFWERGCLPCWHTNLNKCHKHGRQHDDVLAIRGQSGHEIPKKNVKRKSVPTTHNISLPLVSIGSHRYQDENYSLRLSLCWRLIIVSKGNVRKVWPFRYETAPTTWVSRHD